MSQTAQQCACVVHTVCVSHSPEFWKELIARCEAARFDRASGGARQICKDAGVSAARMYQMRARFARQEQGIDRSGFDLIELARSRRTS